VSEWRLDDNSRRFSKKGGSAQEPGSLQGTLESQMEQMSIRIAGMSCGGCVNSVRNALTRLPGVQVRQVEVGSATVTYDTSVTSPESVRAAIVNAGFEPQEG
jgi:copper chaperone